MANRIYNKQVSPKGYKRGGGVDVKKAKEFRKNKKTPIRTFIKNTMEGKYMGDGMRGTAEPRRTFGNKRVRRKMGGALKPVDPKTQKGLSKLPTEVRNKMGYMKDGGKVKKKKPLSRFKKPKPGSYDYTLLNRPKHSPAPIKPKPKG